MGNCSRCGDPHPPGTEVCPLTGASVDGGPCGTLVDRYRVERLLGRGGHGAVYRARHVVTDRPVALKILRPGTAEGDGFDRLVREARATSAIGSPRIVQVFDAGVSERGDAFMAMELLEGCDLRTLTEREGPLPMARCIDLTLQLLRGLSDAHARGIVHRDVKPANVFITRAPGPPQSTDQVKVLDFGISKVSAAGGPGTLPGTAMGTPGYMAPEQFQSARDADPRADIYAAAVILYELIAGVRPFSADSYQALYTQMQGRPRPLREAAPRAPAGLCDIVDRALARDPDARWPTAAAFAQALEGSAPTSAELYLPSVQPLPSVIAHTTQRDPPPHTPALAPVSATPMMQPVATANAPVRADRWPLLVAAAALFVAAGAVSITLYLTRSGSNAPPAGAAEATKTESRDESQSTKSEKPKKSAKATAPVPTDDEEGESGSVPAGPKTKGPPLAILKSKGVAIREPEIVGQLDSKEIVAVLKKALPAMQECRREGASDEVKAQIHVHPGNKITLAQAHPDNKGDAGAARCVANRFKDAAPGWHPGETGIISFEVKLDAK